MRSQGILYAARRTDPGPSAAIGPTQPSALCGLAQTRQAAEGRREDRLKRRAPVRRSRCGKRGLRTPAHYWEGSRSGSRPSVPSYAPTGQDRVTWLEADVTGNWPVPRVDVWHDRAVFHFLTDEADRAAYVAHLRLGLREGGTLIMATFGPGGPEKCSGLPVMRYSPCRRGAWPRVSVDRISPGSAFHPVEHQTGLFLHPVAARPMIPPVVS
jgi:hypothetical protein